MRHLVEQTEDFHLEPGITQRLPAQMVEVDRPPNLSARCPRRMGFRRTLSTHFGLTRSPCATHSGGTETLEMAGEQPLKPVACIPGNSLARHQSAQINLCLSSFSVCLKLNVWRGLPGARRQWGGVWAGI